MFVRFRKNGFRLYASLVRSRRVDGKVRAEHVAALGRVVPDGDRLSIIYDRAALWQRLHENIADLPVTDQMRLMEALQTRVPMPTEEERGAVELAEAEHEAAWWQRNHESTMKVVESHRDLIQHAEDRLAAWRALSENEARNAEEARTKVARLANYRGVLDCE